MDRLWRRQGWLVWSFGPRRRLAVAGSLVAGLVSWLVVPGLAADFRLDAAGDRYGTIAHGIGGHGSYPIRIPGYNNEDAGTLLMHQVGGGDVEAYCIDLHGVRNPAAVYSSGERRIDQVAYILNHHFPVAREAGELADLNGEAAAVQLAVWAFSDSVKLDTVSAPGVPGFAAVLSRARQIVTEALAGWSGWAAQQTAEPALALTPGPPAVAPGSTSLTATVRGGPNGVAAEGAPVTFTVTSPQGTVEGARSAIAALHGGAAMVHLASPVPGPVTVTAQVTVPGLAYLQLNPNVRPNQTLILASQLPVTGSGAETVVFAGAPHLTLSKSVADGASAGTAVEARPGDTISYSLSYANSGNAPAPAVTVADDLRRGGLRLLPLADVTLQGGESRTLEQAAGVARWQVGDVPPGGSGTLQVVARVPASLPDTGSGVDLCNSATITAGGSPPTASNSACAHVTTSPHLVTVKAVDSGDARPGQTLRYTITVSNDGTRDLADVRVEDSLAAGDLALLTDISASAGGVFEESSRAVRWTIGSLAHGESAALGFTARVPESLPSADACFVNMATASAGGATYPSAKVRTCSHAPAPPSAPAPGLPQTGGGAPPVGFPGPAVVPALSAPVVVPAQAGSASPAAASSDASPSAAPIGAAGRGQRNRVLPAAVLAASLLAAAAVALSGLRRPRTGSYRTMSGGSRPPRAIS